VPCGSICWPVLSKAMLTHIGQSVADVVRVSSIG